MSPRLRSTSALLVASLVPFGTYLASLRPDVGFWDTGDLQTVPYILGIPYPTGFPGFVLFGWLWTHLLPIGNVAWRMNMLAAVATSAAAAALASALLVLGADAVSAAGAAIVFGLARGVWDHATYIDVHAVSFALTAFALVAALRWRRDGRRRDFAAAMLLAAAAAAFDNVTVLTLPGLALTLLGRPPAPALAARFVLLGLALVVGTYAYLPLRSAVVTAQRLDPTLALGIPPGRPFWDDHHPSTPAGFAALVFGAEFHPQTTASTLFTPAVFAKVGRAFGPAVLAELGDAVLLLALAGGLLWWRRHPTDLGGAALLALLPLLFAHAYPAESDATRYHAAAYFVLVVCAGYGVAALVAQLRPPLSTALGIAGLVGLAVVIAGDVSAGAPFFGQRDDRGPREFTDRVLAEHPANAVIVAPWLYATPLAYRSYVERDFGDRIVVTADLAAFRGRYREWLGSRPVVLIGDELPELPGIEPVLVDSRSPKQWRLR